MKKITSANYTKDQLYPAVVQAASALLKSKGYVAPVDLLLELRRLTPKQYEDWRFGRAPCLERVCSGSLGKLSRILRILRRHAETSNLQPSHTAYYTWGKGTKRKLQFSKSGETALEAAYSCHYLLPKFKSEAKRTHNQPAQSPFDASAADGRMSDEVDVT